MKNQEKSTRIKKFSKLALPHPFSEFLDYDCYFLDFSLCFLEFLDFLDFFMSHLAQIHSRNGSVAADWAGL